MTQIQTQVMIEEVKQSKRDAIQVLAQEIQTRHDWWQFPAEGSIQGFMGIGSVFIVGDQPSRSEWSQSHPCRRVFYDTLKKVDLGDAHLTDLYKKRGDCSALKRGLPKDFSLHLKMFRHEVEILRPTLIVALGELAQILLKKHLVEWTIPIPRIWHFSYVVRQSKESEYEANMHEIIGSA